MNGFKSFRTLRALGNAPVACESGDMFYETIHKRGKVNLLVHKNGVSATGANTMLPLG